MLSFLMSCFLLHANSAIVPSLWLVAHQEHLTWVTFSYELEYKLNCLRETFRLSLNRSLTASSLFTLHLNFNVLVQSRKQGTGREFQSVIVWRKKLLKKKASRNLNCEGVVFYCLLYLKNKKKYSSTCIKLNYGCLFLISIRSVL